MSGEELAEFLDGLTYGEGPWSKGFSEKFCVNCPDIRNPDGLDFMYCEIEGNVCPHGGEILWWLKQPESEE